MFDTDDESKGHLGSINRRVFGPRITVGMASLLVLALATSGRAATPKIALKFSETLKDKVVCSNDVDVGTRCGVDTADRFAISAKISLTGVDISQFDQNTIFDLSLGSLHVGDVLGDDPRYTTGKTSATFSLAEANSKGKTVVYQTVRVKWSAKQLKVTVKGKTSALAASNLTPILANTFDGSSSMSINDVIVGRIGLGDFSVDFYPVTATGSVGTQNVLGKDHEVWQVSTVKLKGTGTPGPPPPPLIPILAEKIAGGDSHSLAVTSNGTVWAWGDNNDGELGNGGNDDSDIAVTTMGLSNVIAVAGGLAHSLAMTSTGTVWAWGNNDEGELGNGTTTGSNTPVQVMGLSDVVGISAGNYHSLAVASNGTVWAWGFNGDGQLGNGSITLSNTPVQTVGLSNVLVVAAGGYHNLALANDDTVWAWGYNGDGELGNGANTDSYTAVQVVGLSNITAIAAGQFHNLVIMNDGTVWAWGFNGNGELGDGTSNTTSIAVQVVGLSNVVSVGAGYLHSLALMNDGTVWSWGVNDSGQLGDGTVNANSLIPVQVVGLSNVVAIAAGGSHSLAIIGDGTVWTWGLNDQGQLGNNTSQSTNVPVRALVPAF